MSPEELECLRHMSRKRVPGLHHKRRRKSSLRLPCYSQTHLKVLADGLGLPIRANVLPAVIKSLSGTTLWPVWRVAPPGLPYSGNRFPSTSKPSPCVWPANSHWKYFAFISTGTRLKGDNLECLFAAQYPLRTDQSGPIGSL